MGEAKLQSVRADKDKCSGEGEFSPSRVKRGGVIVNEILKEGFHQRLSHGRKEARGNFGGRDISS